MISIPMNPIRRRFFHGVTNTAVVINRKNREWHSVNFMKENSLCQKEIWLGKLLDQNRSEISSKSSMVDVEAFLVVFKALSSLDSVQDASAPRRADVWMNRLLEYNNKNLVRL